MRIIFQVIDEVEIKIILCVLVCVCVNLEMLVSHLGVSLSKPLFLYL